MLKYMTVLAILFLTISKASSQIVDSVEILKIDDTGSNINIHFDIKTHREPGDKTYIRQHNQHKCLLFDDNGHKAGRSKGKADTVYIFLDRHARTKTDGAKIVCTSKVGGKLFTNKIEFKIEK